MRLAGLVAPTRGWQGLGLWHGLLCPGSWATWLFDLVYYSIPGEWRRAGQQQGWYVVLARGFGLALRWQWHSCMQRYPLAFSTVSCLGEGHSN